MAAADKLDLSIALVAMNDLAHYERNARTHPQSQINEIKLSIRKFGFTNPILADLDDGGVIAAGHGRHMAVEQMLEAGETIKLPNGQALPAGYVPVIDCSGWDEVQRRAYTLADNKIAENSGWDDELLKIEIGELLELGADEAPVIGFSDEELASFAGGLSEPPESGHGNYSRKIEAPIYEPKGDRPKVEDLFDTSKSDELIAEIDAANLPPEIATFLKHAAERHTVFDFEQIAEFYCHADAETQALMERSALVIIDFDKAVEGGFVELGQAVDSAWSEDHGDGDEE